MSKQTSRHVTLHWRRTKILATLGPATTTAAMVEKLIKAGVNVFRINMSHGDHKEHRKTFRLIRKVSSRMCEHTAILMDLCGPKIRAGQFVDGAITLKTNSTVTISCSKKIGDEGLIISQYPLLYKDVVKGERILLDDGNLELRVEEINGKEIKCKVRFGGILKNNKGINLPDTHVSVSSFTAKDKADTALAIELGADFLALSFVRDSKDIRKLSNFLKRNAADIPVIAKIEKPEAVQNIDSIIGSAYGIMIARGDLGIELPAEQVPMLQKDLISKARQHNKPVIVATQMLESMITSSRPTRAEVGDVANAALQGADAVMLSAETSIGRYPVRAVRIMDRILREIEARQWEHNEFDLNRSPDAIDTTYLTREAISHAVTSLSQDLKLQGIVIPTRTGTTAIILAANRPSAPLIGVSPNIEVCRKLTLHWGVVPIQEKEKETHDWKKLSISISKRCVLTKTGNTILLVSGFSEDPELSEPVMKIIRV